mgnify:CR=1 FL=1
MWVTKVDVVFIFEGYFSADIVKASILGHIFRKGLLVVELRTVPTGKYWDGYRMLTSMAGF